MKDFIKTLREEPILMFWTVLVLFLIFWIIKLSITTIHSNLTNQTAKVYVYNTNNDCSVAEFYYTQPQDLRIYVLIDGEMVEYVPKEAVKENE